MKRHRYLIVVHGVQFAEALRNALPNASRCTPKAENFLRSIPLQSRKSRGDVRGEQHCN